MLDTHARKYVQPAIKYIADIFIKWGFTANQVTLIAFILGLAAVFFVCLGNSILAITFLWISGFLDAVDGTVAREKNESSPWGTILDITFDRVIEVAMIIAFAFSIKGTSFYMLILTGSIIFSMTVFLTVGALSEKNGKKSFYYQAGFAERTEGFIFFTLMIIFKEYIEIVTLLFAAAIIFTGIQRLFEARKIFEGK